ncbi:hypothetical protein [Bradyrhizobium shewense]|uniref:hypothetical protein n=1 Tax=Bradyrhizobium shewense TaxID=1761772 RepID=UPI00101AEA3A|nr:hypothetical protein [Bradyrhizobium shewense]
MRDSNAGLNFSFVGSIRSTAAENVSGATEQLTSCSAVSGYREDVYPADGRVSSRISAFSSHWSMHSA